MNIFSVHSNVIGQYSNYISSFIEIADNNIRSKVEDYFSSRFNHLFNQQKKSKGTKAFIVYLMNALINSQLLEKKETDFINNH